MQQTEEAITLPDREPWGQGEVTRALIRIESKLDRAATVALVESIKADQLRKDTEQDKAIESVEQDQSKLLFMIVGTALGTAASLIAALAPMAGK